MKKPSHPPHFSRLYPQPCPFGRQPEFMAIVEGRDVDGPVNRELPLAAQLFLHHNGSFTTNCLPIFPTLVNKTTRCLTPPKKPRVSNNNKISQNYVHACNRVLKITKHEHLRSWVQQSVWLWKRRSYISIYHSFGISSRAVWNYYHFLWFVTFRGSTSLIKTTFSQSSPA